MRKVIDLIGLSRFWSNVDKKKASIDGTYPDLVSGDLAGRGESVPASFGFRASGGKSIKDGRAYIKRIKGNSVVWNQLVTESDWQFSDAEGEFANGKYALTPTSSTPGISTMGLIPVLGHKYLLLCTKEGGDRAIRVNWGGFDSNIDTNPVITITDVSKRHCTVYAYQETESFTLTTPRIHDITQMFGAGNEPTTIEDFNARVATLGVDMNAYNEGQVIHCNTESIKSIGDNAWDEEWEIGGLSANGLPVEATNRIRSKNYIPVVPHKTYYVSKALVVFYYDIDYNIISYEAIAAGVPPIPSNCYYLKFYEYGTTTYNHDIMISLVHSGWKQDTDAGYQPYWQDTLPLPIINKYFPQGMKSAGSAHDEIRFNKSSGKWEKVVRIGVMDLGTLDYILDNRFSNPQFYVVSKSDAHNSNILCSKYTAIKNGSWDTNKDKTILISASSNIIIVDSSYTDAASLKASLQGVMLYYELAEPIVTELDAEDQNFRDYYNVADFGTEQSQSSVPSAAFSADIIYQFNAVDMIREHELEITELQNVIATMQAQLASLTSNNA